MKSFNEIFDETKIIAILRGVPEDRLTDVLDAIYDGGIRLAEITYDRTGRVSDEKTAENIKKAVKHTEGRMYIGAGTVLTEKQVRLTKESGGRFIISPDTNPDIITATKNAGLYSLPGAMTISEIVTAHNAGADFVKLFPADTFGPSYVKAVLAPLKGIKLVAVSGVTPENIPDYLKAGCVGFGIGSAIVNAALVKENKLDTIRENAKQYAEACR